MAAPNADVPPASAPIRVAHRAGNGRRAREAALAAGVDWLETDVWWDRGRFVARHDPAVWRLPLTHHRGLIRPAPLRPITLVEVVTRARVTHTRVLIDLKDFNLEQARALAHDLRDQDAVRQVALCGQDWAPLDAARGVLPDLSVFFSLGEDAYIQAYRVRLRDGTAPRQVSIRHTLVTASRAAEWRAAGVTTIAWTVNEFARARVLLAAGIDGITSDSLDLLRRLTDITKWA